MPWDKLTPTVEDFVEGVILHRAGFKYLRGVNLRLQVNDSAVGAILHRAGFKYLRGMNPRPKVMILL